SGCTVMRVQGRENAPIMVSNGLIAGHLGFGLSDEERYLNVRVLGGASPGALAEVVLWKLFRVEVGAAGVSLGVLPIHFGVGVLFYEPRVPVVGASRPEEIEPFEPEPEIEEADPFAGDEVIDEDL
ncbi:MAG: hypothetical protein AAF488_13015, partial [Planctomycetota bacterium]